METTSQEGCEQAQKVQRKATKIIERLEGLEYLERLRVLNLTTLETRFLSADLIEVYKIFEDLDKFNVVDVATRGTV